MQQDDSARTRHMLDSARQAVEFTDGRSRESLDDDAMLRLAIIRLLEILGEAAKAVSPELKDRYQDVPWRQAARTRDRLIHAYFDVEMDIVWEIVTQDLPPLVVALEQLIIDEGF